MHKLKAVAVYPCIAALAAASALNYAIFIFPNSFAPAGIDGICTMIQDITQVSMGYLSLMVNVPLLIAAYILLDRDFTVKTGLYVISFSLCTIGLRQLDLSDFIYYTETNTSIVLAPVAAGTIRGILYSLTLKLNATSGGTDIVAALIRRSKPHIELMHMIFLINMAIALSSYFVYGFKVEPVICSIAYSFITSACCSHLRTASHQYIKFEIVTSQDEALCAQITQQLRCTATVMDAHGGYTGADKKLLVCVVDKPRAANLETMLLNTPDTVFFRSTVDR